MKQLNELVGGRMYELIIDIRLNDVNKSINKVMIELTMGIAWNG